MSDKLQSVLISMALKILRPLVRVMLRNGIACGSFEELVRKVYVDEAFVQAQGNDAQKATVSGVSAQTGLSRKEVKRLHELDNPHDSDDGRKYNRAVRVISGWTNDRRFSTANGVGKPLKLNGGDPSFATLVKDYSGDVPPKAMLKLLEASACVEVNDGIVNLVRHAYVPGDDSEDILRIFGTDTSELMQTIDHNLTTAEAQRRFQRKVSNARLHPEALAEFQTYASYRSQALLEELDNWLSQHEINSNENTRDDANARYVSLGVYYYEKNPEEVNEQ